MLEDFNRRPGAGFDRGEVGIVQRFPGTVIRRVDLGEL